MNANASAAAAANADAFADTWRRQGRRTVAGGVAAIACAAAAMLAWALHAPLAGAVVAAGQVKVDTHRKTVQHRDGGIVREILVREGDRVGAGQTLLVLDDARVDAAHDLARDQLDATRIRLSRLAAQAQDARQWTLPAAFAARVGEPRVAEAAAREAALFAAQRSALDAQARLVQQQLDAIAVESAARERERTSLREATASMQEEVALNEALLQQQFVNKTRVMQLKRFVAEYQSRIDANEAELAQARQRRADLELRLATVRETHMHNAVAEQREANAKLVELEEQWRSANDASGRLVVTAPVAGRVIDLRVTTPGGAIGPRDALLDIVPDDPSLRVEARVGVDAIASLHAGAHADVRLTAYRQRTTPLVDGTVVYVSPDALADRQTGAPYYLLQVELDRASLARANALDVQPGMGAEVYVRGHERTAVEFLLEPLTNASRRALREH
jgi:HlyD family type I secretion membrane fusion protein